MKGMVPIVANMSLSEHHHTDHRPEHHDDHRHDHLFDEAKWSAIAEATEEQGEVLSSFVATAIDWVSEIRGADTPDVEHIIDVGCGPGIAATAFAKAFPTAIVTAADSSPGMLARASARAQRLGVSDRVRTIEAQMPDGIAALGPADVVWASMALHHVGDEVAALRQMRSALRPGGLVVIAEFPPGEGLMSIASPSIEAEAPGLWPRLRTASNEWFALMRASLPQSKTSRPLEEMVNEAGLELVGSRVDRMHLDAPLSDAARRVATNLAIGLARRQLATFLAPDDLAHLDALSDTNDPRCVRNRDDVSLDAAQLILIARRATP